MHFLHHHLKRCNKEEKRKGNIFAYDLLECCGNVTERCFFVQASHQTA